MGLPWGGLHTQFFFVVLDSHSYLKNLPTYSMKEEEGECSILYQRLYLFVSLSNLTSKTFTNNLLNHLFSCCWDYGL